ncbi:MAG TPA: extracellular solute-binding protein [Bacillota bacterium]|nr:extracellular solute-binding protein [Bacillota bacterium]
MKKFIIAISLAFVALSLSACQSGPVLRILNWGEYLNPDVVDMFEEQTGITVKEDTADSNELFYSTIKSRTTAYDLVNPSDYMVEKMVDEEMLVELDYNKLPNYDNVTYMDGVEQIYASMTATTLTRTGVTVDYKDYAVPYFWGTFGIIYNNRVDGLEEALNEHGWDVYFDATNYFPNATRGMYEVDQFAYAAAMIYNGENPNDFNTTLLDEAESTIAGANFTQWGTDILKRNVEQGNLDMAFVYTGDYLDRMYIQLDDGRTIDEIQADFNIYIPETTIVFVDNMVIPYTYQNLDAAHQFINFLLDPDVMALNGESVGYSVTTEEAFNAVVSHINDTDPFYHNWAYANMTYYNKDREGTFYPLTALSATNIEALELMTERVKS